MSNRLRFHGCGGAGTNILNIVQENLQHQDGICEVEFNYIDTSDDPKIKDVKGQIIKIEATTSGNIVVGSGGNRSKNIEHIKPGLIDYARTIGKDPRTIDIVIASASGGSGGPMSAVLIKELLDKGQPVLVVYVTDSSNDKYVDNSITTLSTLSKISNKLEKNITTQVFRNGDKDHGTYLESLSKINSSIALNMMCIGLMFNGKHMDLDIQDVSNMFKTEDYTRLDIPKGLLFAKLHVGDVEGNYALSRSLIDPEVFKTTTVLPSTLHDKIGTCGHEFRPILNDITKLGNLTLTLSSGLLTEMYDELRDILKERKRANTLKDDSELEDVDDFLEEDLI